MMPRLHPGPSDTAPQTPPSVWNYILYADLPGLRASENHAATIPTSVATTTARPDVFVILNNCIILLELTVPTNTPEGLQEARRRNQLKTNYLALLNNLEALGFQSALQTI